ncbi:MAG: hypothetical protein AVDCRST_MAG77-3960 [uncultured Chloroflexi bacterium]|uniref:Uncharacterized protein n=1 Tax=uncultured Chloroflexota bacterium TaxID=166587 RepID=A0A6J4JMD3_9CHLR|nr:MAG: hypothetical protein AVDCRST_MAG77-3960 [uncultured Chloroflexota bacterium]
MPAFDRAVIAQHAEDLTEYETFLRQLTPGQEVRLPIEPGESSRVVARRLNTAASSVGIRLQHHPRTVGAVAFRVMPGEKRSRGRSVRAAEPPADRGAQAAAEPLAAAPKPAKRGRPRKTASA